VASLLEIRNLAKEYPAPNGGAPITSLKGISFHVRRGESLGIIGQSGAGKTTLARCILGLEEFRSGEIRFHGKKIPEPGSKQWISLRAKIQMVWQDPASYLNPFMRVRESLEEPLENFGRGGRLERAKRVRELMEMVELGPGLGERYPHELSGGQCQRVAIARALATSPELLICDEPLSALDTIIQIQIMDLLDRLRTRLGLTYLFISHDLSAVRTLCSRVAVFYQGEVVESGEAQIVLETPAHSYTRLLVASSLPFNP
jgi:ABC-type glutathione transport system ATPase component